MTDREKVISGLESLRDICNAKSNMAIGNGKIAWAGYANTVDDALKLLKEQETVKPNEWIKCSDEMPEEQETIFAKFKGTDKWSPAMFAQSSEDVRVVIVFADGTRRVSHSHTIDGKWECEKSPLKRTVTHWMPNPKLPKEGR